MKKKIRIAFFISSGIIGGGEQLVLSLVKNLSDEFDPFVITYPNSILYKEFLKITPNVIGISNYDNADIIAFYRYLYIIKKYKFDIIHSNLNRASFHIQYLSKILKIPSVATMHGYDNINYYKYHNRIIVSNLKLKNMLINKGLKNISIIFNGLNNKAYSEAKYPEKLLRKYNITKEDKIISIIGRLHFNKGQILFLKKAYKLILKRNIKVLIVGEGDQFNEINNKIKEFKLENNVFLTGLIKDIPSVLKVTTILCHPSLRENQSVVITESMASGVPVVVSNVGNNFDILRMSRSGIVFNNSNEMLDAIKKLFDNRNFYDKCSKNGREFTKKYFNEKIMTKKHEYIYKAILNYYEK